MKLPETWVEARLGDICEINPSLPASERPLGETPVTFVPMSAVDEVSGSITSPEIRTYSDVAKGYTYFAEGDVLFAKITPCMENGKAAIARNLENGIGFGSTEFHVFRPGPELVADYLHLFIRQPWFRQRAKQAFIGSAGQQRVPDGFLKRVKVPLPVPSEQVRIVKVVSHAEAIARARRELLGLFDKLVLASYWESFGHYFTGNRIESEIRLGSFIEHSQYGLSESMDEVGNRAILRMNNITSSGWLDLDDLKYVSFSEADDNVYDLRDGDLLFNRTNSKELVGKTAIWRNQESNFTFASYLIRLRLKPGLLPEYVWATLNSAYGKYRLFNMAKQAVSMANISASDIARFALPKPTEDEQQRFATLVRELEGLRKKLITGKPQFMELVHTAALQALSGELTERWRNDNIETLRREAEERRRRGFKTKTKPVPELLDTPAKLETGTGLESRTWLLDQLSPLQRRILEKLPEWCVVHWSPLSSPAEPLSRLRPLPADDTDALRDFCDAVARDDEALSTDHVKRALDQLAALGLIAKVSILGGDDDDTLTLTHAYRPLRDDERSQPTDLERLVRLLREGNEA